MCFPQECPWKDVQSWKTTSLSSCFPKAPIFKFRHFRPIYILIYWFILQVALLAHPAEFAAGYSNPSALFCLSEFELHSPGRQFSFPCQLIRVPLGDSCGGRFVFIVRLTGSRLVLGGFSLCFHSGFSSVGWGTGASSAPADWSAFYSSHFYCIKEIVGPPLRSCVLILCT